MRRLATEYDLLGCYDFCGGRVDIVIALLSADFVVDFVADCVVDFGC